MDDRAESLLRDSGLAGAAHRIDEEWLSRVLAQDYGLNGELTRIATEKDATYRLRSAGQVSDDLFLVKVSHPEEPLDVVRCQVDVIAWIAQADHAIPLQTVRPALDGRTWSRLQDETGQFGGVLRVYRFIPGRLLADENPGPAQRRAVGSMLARVDLALAGFSHPGEDQVLAWDLTRFLSLESLVELEGDAGRRALARQVFDAFRDRVAGQLSGARTQVLHGDFSPYNVVVDPDAPDYISGVIDFGDVVRGPVVFDPAVLLGNHLLPAPRHPWADARDLLDGYRQAFPLSAKEVGLVAVASAARITLRALIANWRIDRGSDRAEYVREHARHDWGRIANVVDLGFDAAHTYLLRGDGQRSAPTPTKE